MVYWDAQRNKNVESPEGEASLGKLKNFHGYLEPVEIFLTLIPL